jgi:hypothetical protein
LSETIETLKLIFTGSISLSAMLIAIIGALLSQWRWIRDAPSRLRKRFKIFTWYVVVTHILSTVIALSSFMSITQGETYLRQSYLFIENLFILILVVIPIGIILIAYFILKI